MNDEQKGAGDDYPVFEKFTVLGENNAVATDVTITKQQSIEELADEYGAYCYEACGKGILAFSFKYWYEQFKQEKL